MGEVLAPDGEIFVLDRGSTGSRWGKYWSWMGEVLAPDGEVMVLDRGSTDSR